MSKITTMSPLMFVAIIILTMPHLLYAQHGGVVVYTDRNGVDSDEDNADSVNDFQSRNYSGERLFSNIGPFDLSFEVIAGLSSILGMLLALWSLYIRPQQRSQLKSLQALHSIIISITFGILVVTLISSYKAYMMREQDFQAYWHIMKYEVLPLVIILFASLVAVVSFRPWIIAKEKLKQERESLSQMMSHEIKLLGEIKNSVEREILLDNISYFYKLTSVKIMENIYGEYDEYRLPIVNSESLSRLRNEV